MYKAKVQRGLTGFMFVMMLGLLFTNVTDTNFSSGLLYFHLLIIVFLLTSLFIRYKLEIKDGYLTYQFLLLETPLYKRIIHPLEITQIKFVRFGWATKGAIIQTKKGLHIRIFKFEPNHVFLDILDFANHHTIPILKTKDYQILERMK